MNKLYVKAVTLFSIIVMPLLLVYCSGSKNATGSAVTKGIDSSKGLKDYYKNYFTVGVAVSPQGLKRDNESQLILQQFSGVTPENAMKMGPIHPRENFTIGKMRIQLLLLHNAIISKYADIIFAGITRHRAGYSLILHPVLHKPSAKKYCCNV